MAQHMAPSDYANLPVGAPPPGVVPNFDHPQSRATEAYIAMGICIGLTLVVVVLRIYVKLAVTHMWGWDDCESGEMAICLMLTVAGACLMGYVRNSFICPFQSL